MACPVAFRWGEDPASVTQRERRLYEVGDCGNYLDNYRPRPAGAVERMRPELLPGLTGLSRGDPVPSACLRL